METETMLTTFDNPFDPFDEFVPWFLFDVAKGYNTCSRLARIARTSDEFSTIEQKREDELAIDKIIDHDFLNIYKKVIRNIDNDAASISETDEEDEKETEKNETTN